MKKFLALACALACASAFTACHDDDNDDDKDYVADYTSINAVSYIPGAQAAASKVGLNAFMLSDANGYTDVTCYMYADADSIVKVVPLTPSEDFFNTFYGGFCPTAFEATDEAWTPYVPANGAYHSGSGALVCNPGQLCRPLFTRRHFAADMSALTSALTMGDMEGLWVCPTAQYNKLTTADGLSELGISSSPKNVEIRFYVYAYIKSLSLGSWSTLVNMFKTNISSSDVRAKNYAVLAKTDANGVWTVNKDWQYVDLDDVEDYYAFEASLAVVDAATGKTVSTLSLENDGEGENKLNFCMVDDITCESKSLF
mgnify:CR=1 FL=1